MAKAKPKEKPKLTPLERRVDFATKHCSTPDGQRFSLDGREWVRDNYWRALEGYKLWPVNAESLCDDCRAIAGELCDDYGDGDHTRTGKHKESSGGCLGLTAEKIMLVVLLAKRQEGKTMNTAAWAQSVICTGDRESVAFVASSEGQSDRLFEKNYERPIQDSPAMNHACKVVGNTISVPSTKSDFEYLSTSMSGVGDTRTRLIVDECREVPPDVAMAMLPTLFARGGYECKFGHIKTHKGVNDKTAPKTCSVCKSKLTPWYATALFMSSSGILKDTEADWFNELVEHLKDHPHPNAHLIILDGKGNPKIAQKMVGLVTDIFGQLDSTKAYADVETGLTSRRKGEDFMTKPELDAVVDKNLVNLESGDAPCVAFLDTSRTGELTSLVILAEDQTADLRKDWDSVVMQRVDVWDPKTSPGKVIDEDAIEAHFDKYVEMFPLLGIKIDTRGSTWSAKFVKHLQREKDWGHLVSGVDWRDTERNAAWGKLKLYIKSGKIRMMDHAILMKEIRGARRVVNINNVEEVRETSRRKRHLDVAESLASCCYMIHCMINAPKHKPFDEANKGSTANRVFSAMSRGPITRNVNSNRF